MGEGLQPGVTYAMKTSKSYIHSNIEKIRKSRDQTGEVCKEKANHWRRFPSQISRVGIEIPTIENLEVEGEAIVGSKALPTLLNSALNAVELHLAENKCEESETRAEELEN